MGFEQETVFAGERLRAVTPQWAGTPVKNIVSTAKRLPELFVPGEKDSQSGEVILSTVKNVK